MTKPKHCLDCHEPISKNATRCQKCAAIARWSDPDYRERQTHIISAALQKHWQNDDYREQQAQARSDPEFYAKIAPKRDAWLDDPANIQFLSESQKANWENPDYRRRVSRSVSQAVKSLWQTPAYRRSQAAGRRSPAYRRSRADIARAAWNNDAYRRKQSAAVKSWWNKRKHEED
jgi:hypothetical protein